MKFTILSALLWLFFMNVFGQTYSVKGRVIDSESRKALPFVNIVINNSNRGGTTDIDGKFLLRSNDNIQFLRLSYVGYKSQVFPVQDAGEEQLILLEKIEYELPEYVVYPTENPAHRIIRNTINNRDLNDPEKLDAFTYTAYDKMIFTLELDSIPMLDTLEVDTTENFRSFLENHHLFMMESVSERKFKAPDKNVEEVVATKVSGFKDPIFVFLISQWQSTDFYGDQIEIAGDKYVNPISRGSVGKYFFLLQDTLFYGESDTVFILSYRPRLKTNFKGLTGTISINTKKWAVQNVIAEPFNSKATLTFRIEQLYEVIDGEHWFPVQVNNQAIIQGAMVTDSSVSVGIGSGGASGANPDSIPDSLKAFVPMRIPFGIGKRYIRNINLNPELRGREFGNAEVEVDPNATFREEDFWNTYRTDSLTQKELNTYRYIDSVGQAENFDRAAKTFESLMTGKIPWGYFDLDISRFLLYNSYEGLAPGLGLHTNDRLSQLFSIGGFARYGFKDQEFKYGGDLKLKLWNYADMDLELAYLKDVMETSGVRFWDETMHLMNLDNFRDLLIQRMDKVEQYSGGLNFRTLTYLNVHVSLTKTAKEVTNDYQFSIPGESLNVYIDRFNFTEFNLGLRYAYKEKFIKNMRKKISLGTNWPVFWLQYSRGIEGFMDGKYAYNRYDFKVEKSFYTNYVGKTTFRINAGYIDTDIPYTNLYNGNGSYRSFTLYAPNSFATMHMNEFLSNKYVSLYFTHDFEKLLGKIWIFKPDISVATNVGFGWLDFTETHHNVSYKTMEKGYYESGLLIDKLLNIQLFSLGVGGFYRYGPYTFKNGWDNTAFKLSLKFNVGF